MIWEDMALKLKLEVQIKLKVFIQIKKRAIKRSGDIVKEKNYVMVKIDVNLSKKFLTYPPKYN